MPTHVSSDAEISQLIDATDEFVGQSTDMAEGDLVSDELMDAMVEEAKMRGKGKIKGVIGVSEWSDTL